MTIELPLLRLGLAGFSPGQVAVIAGAVDDSPGAATVWELSDMQSADAWWINGARTQKYPGGRIRVVPGAPGESILDLQLPDIDRPLAFAEPLPQGMEALLRFDAGRVDAMHIALARMEDWLAPLRAQFCLAAHIVEHETVLGRGVYDVTLNASLLAVVDMHGEVGVLPGVTPSDFESSVWGRRTQPHGNIPEHFVRSSLSHLMWQYALRTQRDVLPRHYRSGLLYFRRAPRLPQSLLRDAHLLLMRELMVGPASFEELRLRSGLAEAQLARDLSALYFVGSITSNPKRAAPVHEKNAGDTTLQGPVSGMLPSGMHAPDTRRPPLSPRDLTAPASLRPADG